MYGAPSLLSKQAGVGEILHSCLRVDFWDINEMANQMIAAVRSEALRSQLLEGAQQEVSNMSWHKAADKIYEIYRQHLSVGAAA
jgi:glycosyltransferase involved in cell wall biosynthesis